MVFKDKIGNNAEELDRLHVLHSWIPNSAQCRPKRHIKLQKQQILTVISYEWESVDDYLKSEIWGLPIVTNPISGKKESKLIPKQIKLVKCPFPYDLNDNGLHYTLWFPWEENNMADNIITSTIEQKLGELFPGQNFEFAWYENPKMTFPHFYHVQVFIHLMQLNP